MSASDLKIKSKKPIKILTYGLFIIAYAPILSIGMECLLNLLGISKGIALDGSSVTDQYPRFILFCVIVGILALVAPVFLVLLNIIVAERLGYAKRTWWIQSVLAFSRFNFNDKALGNFA